MVRSVVVVTCVSVLAVTLSQSAFSQGAPADCNLDEGRPTDATVVRDAAPAIPPPPGTPAVSVPNGDDGALAIPSGFGLAVISGLADDVRVSSTSSGVSVRMSWPSTAATA